MSFFHEKNHTTFSVSCEKIFKEQLDIEKSYDGILKKTLSLVVDCIEVKSSLQQQEGFTIWHTHEIYFSYSELLV